ncbi:tripartite tricarboxylate transporter substrate binding protein [Ramlibacter sp. AN1015]|uniref:Bug family tripartite tricarboxylate transporter substrate binding protein n=1 Tax=Ramlibacter sp. AN1015 TaxID=3133428 RepID=UPI0030BA7446
MKTARFALFALAATCSLANAQSADSNWPQQPVKLIVGFPAGTSPDLVARTISEPLSKSLGTPVVVENKPGAGGNIGVQQVNLARDGHTFGVTTNGPLTTSKQLYSKLPYDPIKDIKPISLAATSPLVLVTSTSVPANNLKEFIAWAKQKQGGATYGSVGLGSGSHLTMELFASRAELPMVHVPYQGFPAVTNAILGQQIDAAFMAPSGALAQAKAGKVKLLGITSAKPSPLVPDVPTIAETLPNFEAELWTAAIAPASMPEPVAARLTKEISEILQRPEIKEALLKQGWQAQGTDAQGLVKRIEADTGVWSKVIQQANVKVE